MTPDPYAGLGTPDAAPPDAYAGLGTPAGGDPYEGLGTPEKPPFLDRLKAVGTSIFTDWAPDLAKRVAHGAVTATGDVIKGVGSLGDAGSHLVDSAQDKLTELIQGAPLSSEQKTRRTIERAAADTKFGQPSRVATGLGEFAKDQADAYKGDPAHDNTMPAKVAEMAGGLAPLLASGPAAPEAMAAMMGQQGKDDAAAHGADDVHQAAAFALNAPVGYVTQALFGLPAILKSIEQSVGKTVATRIAVETGKAMARGAVENGLMTLGSNVTAKDLVGYDPERDRMQGVGESAAVGATVGGLTAGLFTGLSEGDRKIFADAVDKQVKVRPQQPEAKAEPAAAVEPAPEQTTAPAPTEDLTASVESALPDRESRDFVQGRTKQDLEQAAADAPASPNIWKAAVDDFVGYGIGPQQLDGLDRNLQFLQEKKNARRLKPEQVNNVLSNTFLPAAIGPNRYFSLVNELAKSADNIAAMRTEIQGVRDSVAASVAARTEAPAAKPAPAPLSREEGLQALKAKIEAEAAQQTRQTQDIAAKKATAEKALADAAARRKAENERLAQVEATGRDPESGLIEDLRSVPSHELENFNWDKDRFMTNGDEVKQEDIDAVLQNRTNAAERAEADRAAGGAAGDDLLTVLQKVKLPTSDPALGGELKLLREEMNKGQQMKIFRAGGGDLDAVAEVLRVDHGFRDIKTPADVIDFAQRALRGEKIIPTWSTEANFARRQPQGMEDREAAQARWYENLQRVAPGLAREAELRFGSPEALVHEGAARRDELTGEEEAGRIRDYTAKKEIFYLFDEALQRNTDDVTRLNLQHEMGHAFWDTLDRSTQHRMFDLFEEETKKKTGPLFDDEGNLRENVAQGATEDVQEWFAERLAHANDNWAKRRIDAISRGDGLVSLVAAKFRALLARMAEMLERTGGRGGYDDALVKDFRRFLDQGTRWAEKDAAAGNARHVDDAQLRTYFTLHGVTDEGKLQEAIEDYHRAEERISEASDRPYQAEFDLPGEPGGGGDERAGRPVQRRKPAPRDETAEKLLGDLDRRVSELGPELARSGRVSTIVPELVEGAFPTLKWEGQIITTPQDFAALAATLRNPFQERLGVAVLNSRGKVIHAEVLTAGDIASAAAHPLLVARAIVKAGKQARKYILWHNHPSGDPSPSTADIHVTRQFENTAMPNNAQMMDHIITNGDKFYSISQQSTMDMPAGVQRPAWEKVNREALKKLAAPAAYFDMVKQVRATNPEGTLLVFVNRKNGITGVEMTGSTTVDDIWQDIFKGATRHAASAFFVDGRSINQDAVRRLTDRAKQAGMEMNDASNPEVPSFRSQNSGSDLFRRRLTEEGGDYTVREGDEPRSFDQLLRDFTSLERTRDRYLNEEGRVPRHVLTGLADIREQLDNTMPGWRDELKARQEQAAVDAAPKAEPEAGMGAETEPAEEINPAVTASKRSQLEASSFQRPSAIKEYLGNLAKLFTNFRSALPELPGGAKGREFSQFREGYRMLEAATTATQREAEDRVAHVLEPIRALGSDAVNPREYHELLSLQGIRKKLLDDGEQIRPSLTARIGELEGKLDSLPYHLFRKTVLYRDLWFRAKIPNENGDPISLPFNLQKSEIDDALRDLHRKIAASPAKDAIEEALRRHYLLVKNTREDLLSRGYVIPEELRNPLYFPHLVLDKFNGTLQKVKLDTAADFRGYLQQLTGSAKDIETDYLTAMYYHMGQVLAHNAREDIVETYWHKPYDIKDELEAEAKQINEERKFKGMGSISWRQLIPEGFTTYVVDKSIPLRPGYMIDRQVLADRLGVELGEGDLGAQLHKLGLDVTISPDDIKSALIADEKIVWVVPKPVAEALKGIVSRETPGNPMLQVLGKAISGPQGLWKRWTLYAPHLTIRYNYGNLVADTEKLFSVDPAVFGRLKPALREIWDFYSGGKPSPELKEAFERGVISGVTAGEVDTLAKNQLDRFEAFLTKPEIYVENMKRGLQWGRTAAELREATFRYAKFKADLDRMNNGSRPVYAGAYWRDVEAIKDSEPGANDANLAKAAYISRRTFGDYGDISVSGNALRKYLVPFYSWMEVNFRYHANLLRNMMDMTAGAGATQLARGGLVAASKVVLPRSVAGVLLRLALPYVAVTLWNNSEDRQELEKTLSEEDRRRFHLILGRDASGKTQVVYMPTALSDVVEWFGGNDFSRLAVEYWQGRISFPTMVHEWISNAPKQALNKAVQGVSPLLKAVYTAVARKNIFPDVTDQRSIADYDMNWAILGNMTDGFTSDYLRRVVDKDFYSTKDFGDWSQQLILQVRRRDPEQWGYYATLDRVAAWQQAHGGTVDLGVNNKADAQVLGSFRKAIRAADIPAALSFYQKLLDAGYTAERFHASVMHADPMATIERKSRREFYDSLSPAEKEDVDNAYRYMQRMEIFKNREKQLFPVEKASANYKASFAARGGRPDVFAGLIGLEAERSDADEEMKAEHLLKMALRPR
ncbi:MAG TPA: JAB domain-containing protein [Opitutaceae bacterium]|nr:JAB domain-containing protein [Opitutaceae bacterium]